MRTKLQLYTVPGRVYYNSTRQLAHALPLQVVLEILQALEICIPNAKVLRVGDEHDSVRAFEHSDSLSPYFFTRCARTNLRDSLQRLFDAESRRRDRLERRHAQLIDLRVSSATGIAFGRSRLLY
jgi:hypothetical protein